MRVSKFVRLMLLLALALPLLAACGGGAASNTPTSQVEGFFKDYSAAMSDPDITKAEKQQEWAEKLASHVKPDQREAFKTDMLDALKQVGDGITGMQALAPGAHFNVEFKDLTMTEKITGDTAEVTLTGGTMSMKLDGDLTGVPEDLISQLNREEPVNTALGESSNKPLTLSKVDNTWYLNNPDIE